MSRVGSAGTAGLWTSGNQLAAPDGALAKADNCVIRTKGVLEPRRGQDSTTLGLDADGLLVSGISLGGWLLAQQSVDEFGSGGASQILGMRLADTGLPASWNLGSHSSPNGQRQRMQWATMLGRTYFTSLTGPIRLIQGGLNTDTAVRAGVAKPFVQWRTAHALTDAAGFLGASSQCAYRATVIFTDGNGRQLQSAPSSRVVITNPAGFTCNIGGLVRTGGVTVTVTCATVHGLKPGDSVPMTSAGEANFAAGTKTVATVTSPTVWTYTEAGVNAASVGAQTFAIGAAKVTVTVSMPFTAPLSTSVIVRLWRTQGTGSLTIAPSEDYYLVMERRLTAGEVATGDATITDNTPDVMLGPLAYFSASGDTLAKSKDIPPWAVSMAVTGESGNVMAYANTQERHSTVLQLLATGGASGVVVGDTVTITRNAIALVLTADTSNAAAGFCIFSGGSVSADIERTALSLVDAINSRSIVSGVNVRAFYISGPNDSPGQIQIEAIDDLDLSFTVVCSRPAPFNPQLATGAVTSTRLAHPNRLYLSESFEPDAVPALQYVDVGEPYEQILRVLTLRDSILVLKERSTWVLTGSWPSLRATRLDATMAIRAPDTAAVVSNTCYVLTNQGIAAITTGGVGLVSLPVDADITSEILSAVGAWGRAAEPVLTYTPVGSPWGCSYESERTYLLGLPTRAIKKTPQAVYAYNVLERTWTRWPVSRMWAHVDIFDNKLRMGDGQHAAIRTERKSLSSEDLIDDSETVTISSVTPGTSSAQLVLSPASPVDRIAVGDGVSQSNTRAIVTAVSEGTRTITVSSAQFSTGAATVLHAFECVLDTIPEAGGEAHIAKHAGEVGLHFQSFRGTGYLSVGSEMAPALTQTHSFTRTGFGVAAFGGGPYGDASGPRNERSQVGRDAARGAYHSVRLRIREAWAQWRLQGRTLELDAGNERSRR